MDQCPSRHSAQAEWLARTDGPGADYYDLPSRTLGKASAAVCWESGRLRNIESDPPGNGDGTRMLCLIKQIADNHGIMLSGWASAREIRTHRDLPEYTIRLRQWYRRHGFEVGSSGRFRYNG